MAQAWQSCLSGYNVDFERRAGSLVFNNLVIHFNIIMFIKKILIYLKFNSYYLDVLTNKTKFSCKKLNNLFEKKYSFTHFKINE